MILGYVLTVVSIASTLYAASDPQTLANIGFVGRGYNILNGDPHARTVDPGFQSVVYEVGSYEKKKTSSDFRFNLPDGVSAEWALSCSKNFETVQVTGAKSYRQALAAEVVGTVGGFRGVAFSASSGAKRVEDRIQEAGSIFMETTSKCEAYTAHIENTPPRMSKNFQKALETLPKKFEFHNGDLYWRLFRQFGTHVASQVAFGSRFSIRQEISRKATGRALTWNVNVKLAAQAIAERAYLKSGINNDRTKDDMVKQMLVSSEIFAIGGLSMISSDTEDWVNLTMSQDVLPIRYTLTPISEIVGAELKPHVVKALHSFCETVPNAKCDESNDDSSLPMPFCPPTNYADKWISNGLSVTRVDKVLSCNNSRALTGLRFTYSKASPYKYKISSGCLAIPEDTIQAGDYGLETSPLVREPKQAQSFKCNQTNAFITSLKLERTTLAQPDLVSAAKHLSAARAFKPFWSITCRRSKEKFVRCTTNDWVVGVRTFPGWSELACDPGQVMTGIEFAKQNRRVLTEQKARITCCVLNARQPCQPINT